MPLSFAPHLNAPLQRLVLVSPSVGQITLDMINSIESEAADDLNGLVATIIQASSELAAKKSDATDYFLKLLLELERINALPHEKAQHFTDRVLAYSRDSR